MKQEDKEFERIVVVSVIPQGTDERRIKENLDELEFLALTAGARSEKRFTQRLERANSRTYVGTGKLEEIKSYINEHEIKLVIFDDELSPSQLRNLGEDTGGTSSVSVPPTPLDTDVDSPGEAARRYRHERSGRKPDRD